MKTIFALDSSGRQAGVCITEKDEHSDACNILFEKTLDEGLTHSQTLLPLAEEAFANAGLSPGAVDRFAISSGPGSFTGLRIGMSLLKGMALPLGTALVPVSTLLALALAADEQRRLALPKDIPVESATLVPALNARRGEVYWAAFSSGTTCRRLLPDAAGPAQQMGDFLLNADAPIIFIGDGAEICYNTFKEKLDAAVCSLRVPIARGVAIAAGKCEDADLQMADQARPEYLRLSQAERNLKRNRSEQNDEGTGDGTIG